MTMDTGRDETPELGPIKAFKYARWQKKIFASAEVEAQRWYPSFEQKLKGGFPNRTHVLFYEFYRSAQIAHDQRLTDVKNKLATENSLKRAGVPTTDTRLFWNGKTLIPLSDNLDQTKPLFAKPMSAAGGKGAHIYRGEALPAGTEYLLQSIVRQNEETGKFNPDSLNTLRAITYRKRDGSFHLIATTLRMGVGNSPVDNATSGGIYCTIDPTSGELYHFARGGQGQTFRQHPHTGVPFHGTSIRSINNVRDICRAAHETFDIFPCLALDVALAEDGPKIIEVNTMFGLKTLAGFPHWRSRALRHFVDDHAGCKGGFTAPAGVVMEKNSIVCAELRILGTVQGIGFRRSLQALAERMHLTGEVENLVDGSVAARIRGALASIEIFVQAARTCNPGSSVEEIRAVITQIVGERPVTIVKSSQPG